MGAAMNAHANRTEWTDGMVTALRSYEQAGMSAAQIAHEMGLSRYAVLGKRWRLDNPQPPKPERPKRGGFTMAEVRRMSAMWREGLTAPEIAARTNRTPSSVYMLMIRHRDMFPLRQIHPVHMTRKAAPPTRADAYPWIHPSGATISLPLVRGYATAQEPA